MLENSSVAEQLAASQEGLGSIELVGYDTIRDILCANLFNHICKQ
jgi:hypothetical protein